MSAADDNRYWWDEDDRSLGCIVPILLGLFCWAVLLAAGYAIVQAVQDDPKSPPVAAEAAPEASHEDVCGYSDVLALELTEAAYDLPAGYTVCVHVDQVRDLPRPTNP